jgi:hypothetical protein
MASVFEALDEIRQRPGLYLGGDDTQRVVQLGNLEQLLSGYALALRQHGVRETVTDFNRELAAYLWTAKGWSASCGAVAAVREHATSNSDIWDLFGRCVDEFRAAVEGHGQPWRDRR